MNLLMQLRVLELSLGLGGDLGYAQWKLLLVVRQKVFVVDCLLERRIGAPIHRLVNHCALGSELFLICQLDVVWGALELSYIARGRPNFA